MDSNNKRLGIIEIVLPKIDYRNYISGWIKTCNNEKIYFHENSFLEEGANNKKIEKGIFVRFVDKISNTKKGERNDATCGFLLFEDTLISEIVEYTKEEIEFIYNNASLSLKKRIDALGIETLSLTNRISDKQKDVGDKKCIKSFIEEKSFLENLFNANSDEYNEILFKTIINGIHKIDSKEVFTQCEYLLQINRGKIENSLKDLNSVFYNIASDEYKFLFWFKGYVEYCSTDILRRFFEDSDLSLKQDIIKRCNGDDFGFLVYSVKNIKSNVVEEVYFKGIEAKLLEELELAEKSISIAVAWFTKDSLFNILCEKLKSGVKVELIIINDYINNWELGLPFQEFIDLGGRLYLSELPYVMHHKFCIIDNNVIFNGSYNWTYFAEKYNDENVMFFKGNEILVGKFNEEFELLKSKL
ncbi:phospholipase D-like domain-containing protein [Myroides albus]|uniref:phospholipase D-like domain-containing protein n=1 Tax=Myroides albus TaxID=2562892 RepID=UPI002159AF4E|nr:phospholipase D-like domain-containing protein [Myroides albus]UVD80042.1 phospholipase D-like domain-containing protein [Myroides albus]